MISQLFQDARFGIRMLRRNPGFTTVVILTLALGIGINTAVFSVLNAALLRPLSYPHADRLVWLANYDFRIEHRDNFTTRPEYLLWRDQTHAFDRMTAYGNQDLPLIAGGEAGQERVASVAGDFWDMVGARVALGRLFNPGEADTMVLSNAMFNRRFGGDSRIVGKTVAVNGHVFTITGVLAADFRFLFPQQIFSGDEMRDIDAYIPFPDALMRLPQSATRQWDEVTRGPGPAPYDVYVVARLRPGVLTEQARAEMENVYTRVAQDYPEFERKFVRLHFASLKEKLVGNARRALIVLMVSVGFVLLIACANVANLLLARGSVRHREIAIRAAVGAHRMRVLRQLLTESVVLALIAGAASLLLARAAIAVMLRIAPQAVPRLEETTIDPSVLAFTLVVSLVTGLLFGLAPAISIWKADLCSPLKSDTGAPSASAGRFRIRGFLVPMELALAIMLLTGAGLMLKSYWRMSAYPPGFSPESILTMRVPLSGPRYNTWPPKAAYVKELLDQLQSTPGVLWAGIEATTYNVRVNVGNSSGFAAVRMVSSGYLRAIGVPLIEGRWPADSEALDTVMVNESFARSIAGGGNPIGRTITGSFLSGTIVGIVADFKHQKLDAEPSPEVYYPYERAPVVRSIGVVVRISGDVGIVAPAIRKVVSNIDRTQPFYDFQTLEQALADSIAPRRFNLFLLGTFAATALLLALVGIYGVMAYSVSQRTHEIGIRLALGARRGEIVAMVVRQGMALALTGIVTGVVAALGLIRLMASLLYDVKPNDPATFTAAAVTVALTALLACWGPAFKAARVDPMVALRHE